MWSIRPNTRGSLPSTRLRIALAANRAAGAGLGPEALAAALRGHGAEVTLHGLTAPALERIAAAAPDRVAVAGGDGSVAPVAELAGRLGVPLAVIPAGTANDFARAAGLPEEPSEAAALAATGTATRPLELGRLADGRPFVNVASAGLSTLAAHRARPLKPRLGPLAYALGAARAALSGRPLPCLVRVDGDELFEGRCWQVILAVTGAFGGGAGVEAADPRDGELDVLVLPAGPRLALARRAWGMRMRTLERQRDVPHRRGRVIEVRLPPDVTANVDGELRPAALERVTARARAYALVVPG
jgi:diacylglycerol kinase family enzyme